MRLDGCRLARPVMVRRRNESLGLDRSQQIGPVRNGRPTRETVTGVPSRDSIDSFRFLWRRRNRATRDSVRTTANVQDVQTVFMSRDLPGGRLSPAQADRAADEP